MKASDLRSLLPALVLFLTVLMLSAWIWRTTGDRAASVRTQKENLELAHAAARSRLMQSDAEKNLILAHLSAYKRLEQRGVTGRGNRLVWLEAAQKSNETARLYGLQYTLEPAASVPGVSELEQTPMKLRMPLLTENDLFAFLDGLDSGGAGLFQTRSCTLSRSGSVRPEMINKPGLEVECELLWFNTREP